MEAPSSAIPIFCTVIIGWGF